MKTLFIYVVSLLVLFCTLAPLQSIHAENTMFTTTRLNDWASTAIKMLEPFGFNIAGYIVPSFQRDKQTAIFGYQPYAITAAKFGERNLPGTLRPNGKIKDWDAEHEVRRESLYGAILKASAEHGDNVTSPECYISEDNQISDPIDPVRPLWQHGYALDALLGLQTLDPVDGMFDFNRPKMHLAGMNPGEDCKKHFRGTEDEPVENDQVQLSHFGPESKIEAFMRETIIKVISEVVKVINGVTQTVTETEYEKENAHQQVILTKKERQPYQESNCDWTIKPCAGNQVGNYSKDLDKHGGFPAGFIADAKQEDVEAHATLWDNVTIVGFPVGKVEDFDLNANKMKHGFNTMACTGVPSKLQDKAIIGDKTNYQKIQEYCNPEAKVACTPDTWEQIVAGLPSAINKAAAKYAPYFPISQGELAALLKVIFDMEMGNDPDHNGANYACEDNGYSAFGPFQIKTETYADVTNNCKGEYISDDIKQCNDDGLSRCMVEDAAELAARVLLISGGRWEYTPGKCEGREHKLSSMSELYTAVCNYGEGDKLLAHLGNKTYCQYAFEQLGWAIPTSSSSL